MAKASPREKGIIRSREELIYALSEAAELEHGLTCIYLFAAFSIKRATYEGIDPVQQDTLRNWESVLLAVAKQEMEHLGLVCNLLNAIGGPQHFDRPNLPQPPRYYQTEGAFTLEKFSKRTMRRFLEFEKPAPTTRQPGIAPGPQLVPAPVHVQGGHTVQDLYEAIRAGFVFLDNGGKGGLFIGPEQAQIVDDQIVVGYGNREYGITMVPVTDLDSALEAIDLIVEQGEGVSLEGEVETPVQEKVQTEYRKLNQWVRDLEKLRQSRARRIPKAQAAETLAKDIALTEKLGMQIIKSMEAVQKLLRGEPGKAGALAAMAADFRALYDLLGPDSTRRELRNIQKRLITIGKYDVEGLYLSVFLHPDCHYLSFWKVYQEMKDIDFQPARRVARNPALRHHADNAGKPITIIDHPYSRQVEEVFNASYETMVQMLIIVFSFNGISEAARTLLINTAFFPLMTMTIRPLSEIITQLPAHAGAERPGDLRAGPAFEYYDHIAFLPNREAGWKYLAERLDQISDFSQRLSPPPDSLLPAMGEGAFDYLVKTMATFTVNIKRIAENFRLGIDSLNA